MAVDIFPTGDDLDVKSKKKSKKVKSKTSGEQPQSSEPIEVGDIRIGDETSQEPVRKSKKDKKKSKEHASAQPGATGGDAVVVDTHKDSGATKRDKKKRKREEEPSSVTSETSSGKKKRKASDDTSIQDSAGEAAEHRKEKKAKDKKKRKHHLSPEIVGQEAPAETVASTSQVTATPPSSSEIAAFLKKNSISIHGTTPLVPILSFNQLDVPERLRSACDGFNEPTPIQACSWPAALAGQDVVGIAETGSGKTLAFGLPALARLLSSSIPEPKKGQSTVSILVLAPTRELAIQTHDTLSELGHPFRIASVALFGGVEKRGQIDALRNITRGKGKKTTTRIVVGTPGRILDLINEGVCDLSHVRYLVLDEADRMLDKGFENDIREIIGHTQQGEARQTLMFSATWPEAVRRLAASFQLEPVRVTVGSDDLTANSRVDQAVEVFDDTREKDSRLLKHLHALMPRKKAGSEEMRILVFALYKKEATRVENMLHSKGFSVGGLHGDMSQVARMEALHNFKTGKTGLLVATDVAARGLDIPNVAAVINYTFPLTIEDYIHRIGRTGRGGKSGKSITFFTGDNHERSLAGELARVLHESGFEAEGLKKFPMTIKKKTHSVYGAFYRDDIPTPSAPTKIVFD